MSSLHKLHHADHANILSRRTTPSQTRTTNLAVANTETTCCDSHAPSIARMCARSQQRSSRLGAIEDTFCSDASVHGLSSTSSHTILESEMRWSWSVVRNQRSVQIPMHALRAINSQSSALQWTSWVESYHFASTLWLRQHSFLDRCHRSSGSPHLDKSHNLGIRRETLNALGRNIRARIHQGSRESSRVPSSLPRLYWPLG